MEKNNEISDGIIKIGSSNLYIEIYNKIVRTKKHISSL